MATTTSPVRNFKTTCYGIIKNKNTIQRLIPSTSRNCSVSSYSHSVPKSRNAYHYQRIQPILSTSTQKHVRSLNCVAEKVKAPVEEEISRATLIWRAIKLPMYTVAFTPVTVGAAAAYWQTGIFSSFRYFLILASYILVIAWLNLSNDVYDFDTGADINKKESVVNLFGGRESINFIAWFLLALGFFGLTVVAIVAGNTRSLMLLASAVFCFCLYQCPPFRLSYYGVGEPLLFIAFGPFSTLAFYLLHSTTRELPISGTVVWSSVLVGLTTSLILFCSHFHQIKDDKAVGKISPLVRLGTQKGSQVVKMAVMGLYSLLLVLGVSQVLPFASIILCAMTLPMGNLIVSFVEKNHADKTKIFMSKYFCVRLHTIFGIALATGLVVTRMFAGKQLILLSIL